MVSSPLSTRLVFDLDEVVVALVDPRVFALGFIEVCPILREFPSLFPSFSNRLPSANGMNRLAVMSTSHGGVNARAQSPSGMPAQIACQVGPNMVAQNAIIVPRTRITPFVPEKVDQHEAGQERAEDAADHPPGINLADRRAGAAELLQPVDCQLGNDGADRAHRDRGAEEHERDQEQDPERPGERNRDRPEFERRELVGLLEHGLCLAAEEHIGEKLGLGVQRNDDQRDDRRRQEQPARLFLVLDEISDLAPRKLPKLKARRASTPITLVQP